MEIILQPLASNVDKNNIYQLANDISTEFKNKGTVSAGTTVCLETDAKFQWAFDTKRNQWNSPKLLDPLFEKFKPDKDTKIADVIVGKRWNRTIQDVYEIRRASISLN